VAKTERLRKGPVALRYFRESDAAAVAASCADPEIPRFTMMPDDLDERQALAWIVRRNGLRERGLFAFAITADESDTCIGQMGVGIDRANRRAQMFYWLDRSHRGRGLTTTALQLITGWAFTEFDIVRAQLVTHPENASSQRVAVKAGYRLEGLLRAWEPVKDDQPDVLMFSRLREDPAPA